MAIHLDWQPEPRAKLAQRVISKRPASNSKASNWNRSLLKPSTKEGSWQLHRQPYVVSLSPHQILIRTSHVGLTPFDWQGVTFGYDHGRGCGGRDGAGIVVKVGSDCGERFKIGDRVRHL